MIVLTMIHRNNGDLWYNEVIQRVLEREVNPFRVECLIMNSTPSTYMTNMACWVWQIRAVVQEPTNPNHLSHEYHRQPHLNNVYTVFGKKLDGWEALDTMEKLPLLGTSAPKKSIVHKPVRPPIIQRITIHANPLADEGIVYPTQTWPPEKVQQMYII